MSNLQVKRAATDKRTILAVFCNELCLCKNKDSGGKFQKERVVLNRKEKTKQATPGRDSERKEGWESGTGP